MTTILGSNLICGKLRCYIAPSYDAIIGIQGTERWAVVL